MDQMRLSTIKVSSVMLRPKKFEIQKKWVTVKELDKKRSQTQCHETHQPSFYLMEDYTG
jgi:hypothetical protein